MSIGPTETSRTPALRRAVLGDGPQEVAAAVAVGGGRERRRRGRSRLPAIRVTPRRPGEQPVKLDRAGGRLSAEQHRQSGGTDRQTDRQTDRHRATHMVKRCSTSNVSIISTQKFSKQLENGSKYDRMTTRQILNT